MKGIFSVFAALLVWSSTAVADHHEQPTVYGQYYSIIVSDPAAFVAAMTKYRNSPTGQKMPSQVTLSASVANGPDAATHVVSVFYPSLEAMDMSMQMTAQSKDSAEFFATVGEISTLETENVFTVERSRGQVTTPNSVQMLFGLNVTDQAAFMAAFDKLWSSKASTSFTGMMSFGRVLAMGEQGVTHWVSFQAKDMQTLITGVDAVQASAEFAEYARKAKGFRTLSGQYINRQIASFDPPQQ